MEQIKLFLEKVKNDETLQASLKELAERAAGVEEVVALANEKGFCFTKEKFESFVKENLSAEELSEEQLAAASGGKVTAQPVSEKPLYMHPYGGDPISAFYLKYC